jgi:hypothetical protein
MFESTTLFETDKNEDQIFEQQVLSESLIKERAILLKDKARRASVDFSNSKMSVDNDLPVPDVREALFESIPEPYPHTINFQKVIITDADDAVDQDTIFVCKSIKECLTLREKYISKHPIPPQDLDDLVPDNPISSPSLMRSITRNSTNDYRRRHAPNYDVFTCPLPPSTKNLKFSLVKGIVSVF